MKKMKKKLMVLIALAVIVTMTGSMNITVHAMGGQIVMEDATGAVVDPGKIPTAVTPWGTTVYGCYYDFGYYDATVTVDFPVEYLLAIDATGITDDMTDYEKCVRINNYLCAVAEYGERMEEDALLRMRAFPLVWFDVPMPDSPEEIVKMYEQAILSYSRERALEERSTSISGIGLIRNGKAICMGYADAFQTMTSMLGMESYILKSSSLDHAWNVVIIDGVMYFVDVTWNDSLSENRYLMSTELWGDHYAEDIMIYGGSCVAESAPVISDNAQTQTVTPVPTVTPMPAQTHEHVWKEHTTTNQVWIPNVVTVDDYDTRYVGYSYYICDCNFETDNRDVLNQHLRDHVSAGEIELAGFTIQTRYREERVKVGSHEEDRGYYETSTYVDYYYCDCGAIQ